jgi:hypothetical protein
VAPRPLGALELVTTHAGPATDPDGYTLVLNGVSIGHMAVEDTLLLSDLPEAEDSVGLADLAPNCDSGGGNPRGVGVQGDRTTRVIFQVKCLLPDPGTPRQRLEPARS